MKTIDCSVSIPFRAPEIDDSCPAKRYMGHGCDKFQGEGSICREMAAEPEWWEMHADYAAGRVDGDPWQFKSLEGVEPVTLTPEQRAALVRRDNDPA